MDTLGTQALRERVLAAWAASPARFREDANAEEELALGAYRDRLIVELAQNAADAAAQAGRAGRLLLRFDGSTLLAANTGAPLDTAGVEGLSTLRASAKRHAAAQDPASGVAGTPRDHAPAPAFVGRFGVGFAAVLAVTDEPAVVSRAGGARWSRADTLQAVSEIPELSGELARRTQTVPILRLPFPADPDRFPVPGGFDTIVVLPMRDESAVATAREQLNAVDETLLLVLPGLAEITVDVDGHPRTFAGGAATAVDADDGIWERQTGERRWRLAVAAGRADAALLAGRPVEERARPDWSVSVAVPVDDGSPLPLTSAQAGTAPRGVVHAPTPTDDRTNLPALVIGSFPLDSTRRRIAPGPLTDHLVEQTGAAYARLVASFHTPSALALIPGLMGASEIDAAFHGAIQNELTRTAFIPSALPTRDAGGPAESGKPRLRPTDVQLVDGLERAADPERMASFVSGLPARAWWRPDVLRRLGANVRQLAELVDELGALDLPPSGWREIYAALDGADPEALATVPVPLVDGRQVRGPRGTFLPGELDAELLAQFPLRTLSPEAAHPLLRRLGAVEATPAAVLRDPAVQAAVESDDDAVRLSDPVLRLVAASGLTVADEPWLGGLLLPDATGALAPASDLLLPGSPILAALDVDPTEYTVADGLLRSHGSEVLRAVGVRDGFGLAYETDTSLDEHFWHDLDDEDGWVAWALAQVPAGEMPPLVPSFRGVRDLDLVRDDAWPQALRLLATDPATRQAVVEPTHVLLADGTRRAIRSYASWWLSRHGRLDGRRIEELCAAGAEPTLRALLHPTSPENLPADEPFTQALGLARSLADVPTGVLLERCVHPASELGAAQLMDLYAELGRRDPETAGAPPERIRIPDGHGTRLADADEVVVCSAPHWLQLGRTAALPGPPELAELLDVDLADDVYPTEIDGTGVRQSVPAVVRTLLPESPATYVEHDDLRVGGQPVEWWVDGGTVHASTMNGLARGLCWVTDSWPRRWLVTEALQDPDTLPALLAEDVFG